MMHGQALHRRELNLKKMISLNLRLASSNKAQKSPSQSPHLASTGIGGI